MFVYYSAWSSAGRGGGPVGPLTRERRAPPEGRLVAVAGAAGGPAQLPQVGRGPLAAVAARQVDAALVEPRVAGPALGRPALVHVVALARQQRVLEAPRAGGQPRDALVAALAVHAVAVVLARAPVQPLQALVDVAAAPVVGAPVALRAALQRLALVRAVRVAAVVRALPSFSSISFVFQAFGGKYVRFF